MFVESRTPLPGIDEFEAEQVNLPWWLGNDDIERICAALRDFERVAGEIDRSARRVARLSS